MAQDKGTRTFYEENAESFATLNNNNEQMKKYHKWMEKYLGSGTIYDLGCGTGRDTSALKELGFNTIGFDYSKAMLKVAQREYPECTFRELDLLGNGIKELKQPDGIWACASLLHFHYTQFITIVNKIYDLLKSNGYFYISMKLKPNTHSKIVGDRFFQYYSKEDLITTLKEVGFLTVEKDISKGRNDDFISLLLRK